ncbi:hypothetical protein ACLOJK_021053 [Asimina triloba]
MEEVQDKANDRSPGIEEVQDRATSQDENICLYSIRKSKKRFKTSAGNFVADAIIHGLFTCGSVNAPALFCSSRLFKSQLFQSTLASQDDTQAPRAQDNITQFIEFNHHLH